MKTRRLYYEDSHMKEFDATVLACRQENGKIYVLLDQTAFFPESGGQTADQGTLGSLLVSDVQIIGGEIWHIVSTPLTVGQTVRGVLKWPERFAKMQSHSGEHILSGLVFEKYGYTNVGFHMGADGIDVDFSGEIPLSDLKILEQKANEVIWRNAKFTCFFPTSEELKTLHYRSKLELTEDVRIVEIEGIDSCACCAPHVYAAGEIGQIRILSSQRLRGGTRILLLCGSAAYEDSVCKYENASRISVLLSAKPNEIANAVDRLRREVSETQERCRALQKKMGQCLLQSLPLEVKNPCFFVDFEPDSARQLCNLAMEQREGICGVFCPAGDGYRYIIGSKSIDLRANAKKINEAVGGRGGGQSTMIQGSASASQGQIETFFASFMP